jgi:hypothetical protein
MGKLEEKLGESGGGERVGGWGEELPLAPKRGTKRRPSTVRACVICVICVIKRVLRGSFSRARVVERLEDPSRKTASVAATRQLPLDPRGPGNN